MKRNAKLHMQFGDPLLLVIVLIGCYVGISALADKPTVEESPADGVPIPTGMMITPTAARGAIFQDLNPGHPSAPDVRASGAAAVAASPDGKLLAIQTNGYNTFSDRAGKVLPELSTDYLFLFDVTGPQPRQLQVLPMHTTFQGLAWALRSNQLFASGGIDDAVVEFVRKGSAFVTGRTFRLGHNAWVGPDTKPWIPPDGKSYPGGKGEASGLAVSPDGTRLLVANIMNDSVSLIDIATGQVSSEQDLRPGIINPKRRGQPGGSYPRAVVWSSPSHAYVASERDREVISLAVDGSKIHVDRRMSVQGQPAALVANRSGSRLYVALDTTNRVVIFDTANDHVIESFDAVAPQAIYTNVQMLGGANTNALALTPDERTLLVSNGGQNAIAVVRLGEHARGVAADTKENGDGDDDRQAELDHSAVIGLVPTGWYPDGVTTSKDGSTWYVVNSKSPTGPNVSWCSTVDPVRKICVSKKSTDRDDPQAIFQENQHLQQLETAGLLALPAPRPLELARLTKQVAHNNHFDRPDKTMADERLFSFLRDHIKHVIYILKENQPYDAILGDLEVGNGDPRFTLFPEMITPNHHAIARNFVTLDNTLVSGEGSFQGFMWTYAAQTTDYNERNEPLLYASRAPFDSYGYDRQISMGYPTSKERHAELPTSPLDPDILPGTYDVDDPDGPGGAAGKGYLWDVALSRGLKVRNWGLSPDPHWMIGWFGSSPVAPGVGDAYTKQARVFWTSKVSLRPYSDPFFRPLDTSFPDYWRAKEWKREFTEYCAGKSAPNLMLMWLGGDHTGAFDKAIDGVNTPEAQLADNDYALGLVIEAVANSPFAKDTLIISIEDDAWNSADHVDSHRTVALFAGPYVRHHAVVSTRYTTVNVVKTIEEILGIGPIGLNDALATPMSDIFDTTVPDWSYKAVVPDVLRSTQLPLPRDEHAKIAYPRHSAAYWTRAMAGQDFSAPDRIDRVTFSRALWRGLKGLEPYPTAPAGENAADDLRR
jgi:DNA-binding beta-propeller fold protein YncE